MIKRVMGFTPLGPRGIEAETATALLSLQWPGALRLVIQRDNPHSSGRENILHQYQQGRELFLAGGYDALLVIEADIVPPADALLKLARLIDHYPADLAYGVYRFRVSNVINVFERYPGRPRNPGESLTLHPHKLAVARAAGVTPCSGGGLGCVLIARHVLEQFEFRHEDTAHCDTWFNRDVLRGGLVQMADMSVICGHVREDGEVLWPW